MKTKFKKGQKVSVLSKGKLLHEGVIVGFDKVFTDIILVGIERTLIPGVTRRPGRKFISIFHASEKSLRARV